MRKLSLFLAVSVLLAADLRAGSVEVDFDPKAEFERYKTWAWVPDREKGHRGILKEELIRERIETTLGHHLQNLGLVAAGPGETADVLVRYQGDVGTGKTIQTSSGAIANWVDPGYATIQFQEQSATLIVDLIDAKANTLSWRLYVNEGFGGPNDQPGKIRKAIERGFEKYPPSTSAREKKARALEKQRSGSK